MDVLTNKRYEQYDYISRYTAVPYYYNTIDKKDIYGIGSNLNKQTGYILHQVQFEDTLDGLALSYYGNPTFWWVIAYFNNIQDAFTSLRNTYTTLKIPSISSIEFGAER